MKTKNISQALITTAAWLCFMWLPTVAAGQNAETVLGKAAQMYEKAGGISAQFSSVITSPGQTSGEDIEGTIDMKGDKFVLITPEIHTFFNGTTQWVYMEASDEVNISTPSGEELQLINPILLLKTYKKDYMATYNGERTVKGGGVYDIELTPKKRGNITRINLQIAKLSFLPSGITVVMKNGSKTVVSISRIKTGINKPDSYFVFKQSDYPEAEIIDLR